MLYALCDFLAGEDFIGPDLVFKGIVLICLFDGEACVGVSRPSSAEIEAFIDPSDPVFPADSQACRIILAVAHIEKSDFSHRGRYRKPEGRPDH